MAGPIQPLVGRSSRDHPYLVHTMASTMTRASPSPSVSSLPPLPLPPPPPPLSIIHPPPLPPPPPPFPPRARARHRPVSQPQVERPDEVRPRRSTRNK